MSKAYAEKKPKNMRIWNQRPGAKDKDGKIIYFTEQHQKDECDVNNIIRKYDKTGLITHIASIEAKYGDMTGQDYKDSLNKIILMNDSFSSLPSKIRKRFDNTPEKLLKFMEEPKNRKEAIKLGLIRADWTEKTDGLGEHVKKGENKKIKPDIETKQVKLPTETTT